MAQENLKDGEKINQLECFLELNNSLNFLNDKMSSILVDGSIDSIGVNFIQVLLRDINHQTKSFISIVSKLEKENRYLKLESNRLLDEHSWMCGLIGNLRQNINQLKDSNVVLTTKIKQLEFDNKNKSIIISKMMKNDQSFNINEDMSYNNNNNIIIINTNNNKDNNYKDTNYKDNNNNTNNTNNISTTNINNNNNQVNEFKLCTSSNFDTTNETSILDSSSLNTTSRISNFPPNLSPLYNLIEKHVIDKNFNEARTLCEQLLVEIEQLRGPIHSDVATIKNIMADIVSSQGEPLKAIEILKESLNIREKVVGRDHIGTAAILNNLAVLSGRCGIFEEAENYCLEALKIREKILGKNHPDIAKQINNMALIYLKSGKYDDAECCYKRSLAIYVANFGEKNPNTLKTRLDFALCMCRNKKYKSAENEYKEIIAKLFQNFFESKDSKNDKHEFIGNKLNDPYEEDGGWHKASKVFIPNIMNVMERLSNLYKIQNKQESVEILEKFLKEIIHNPKDLYQNKQLLKYFQLDYK